MNAKAFFYKHAGYGYNPATETPEEGRLRCATELAEAESVAKARGWQVVWSDDFSDADDDYRRVISAELASEALYHLQTEAKRFYGGLLALQ
jgi:hypothetical protein